MAEASAASTSATSEEIDALQLLHDMSLNDLDLGLEEKEAEDLLLCCELDEDELLEVENWINPKRQKKEESQVEKQSSVENEVKPTHSKKKKRNKKGKNVEKTTPVITRSRAKQMENPREETSTQVTRNEFGRPNLEERPQTSGIGPVQKLANSSKFEMETPTQVRRISINPTDEVVTSFMRGPNVRITIPARVSKSQNRPIEFVKRVNLKDILVDDSKKLDDYDQKDCFYSPQETVQPVEQILEDLEKVYVEERSKVVRKDGFISTPIHALKEFALKYNLTLHNDFVVIPHEASGKSTKRVEITMGEYKGVGEAFKGPQAAQMAALDILIKLHLTERFERITPYALVPGWRIKARIVRDLEDICRMHKLKPPKFHTKSNIDQPDVPLYTISCSIGGGLISEGVGDRPFTAKKLAAYHAIEYITGVKLPKEFVALGEACTPLAELMKRGYKPSFSGPASTSAIKKATSQLELSEIMTDEARDDDVNDLNMKRSDRPQVKNLRITVSRDRPARKVMYG